MKNNSQPEAGLKPVRTREELIYLLSRASELEHGLACVYLFAAYSLKNDISEGGMSVEQAAMVSSWKRKLAGVAVEEMLHLAQVNNMLTAIGGAPNFRRTNFPLPESAFPFGISLSLEPFSMATIERFICYEIPEEGILSTEVHAIYSALRDKVLSDQEVFVKKIDPNELKADKALVDQFGADAFKYQEPFEIDFKTVGEFYHKIESGFECMDEKTLFIGPREAQANARFVDLGGQLISVIDRDSACRAIEMIVEQGEAPTELHPDCHFMVFDSIRNQYIAALDEVARTGINFEPVRPTASNPMTRFYDDTTEGTLILDPLTHTAADVFNVTYDTMLQMLFRFFAHNDESEEELQMLSRATLRMMTTVIRPMGEALAKMPVGNPNDPNQTAGPGFGYNRDIQLLPHKKSAWIFFAERLLSLAKEATELAQNPNVPMEIWEASASLQAIADMFGQETAKEKHENIRQEFNELEELPVPQIMPELNGPYLVKGVTTLLNSKGEQLHTEPEMALCRCGGSKNKPFCDGTHAYIGFESKKLPGRTPDMPEDYTGDDYMVHDNRGICQHSGFCTDQLPEVFRLGQEPFIDQFAAETGRIALQTLKCPSGALSFSPDNFPVILSFEDSTENPHITISKNGPYRVKGNIKLDAEFLHGASNNRYTICRCGGSKNKPFCDGTHWYNNFSDDKN